MDMLKRLSILIETLLLSKIPLFIVKISFIANIQMDFQPITDIKTATTNKTTSDSNILCACLEMMYSSNIRIMGAVKTNHQDLSRKNIVIGWVLIIMYQIH